MTARDVPDATLAQRVGALGALVGAASRHVNEVNAPGFAERLHRAADFVERASARLRLSDMDIGGHTVVALAGATGGGKSSLFNALARHHVSTVGHLRPTTGQAHACVWGPDRATDLLDWLSIAEHHRFQRESALDAEDEAGLRGLVLLDLPDMDSLASANREVAGRLVGIVDLVVWVLDPQKYADQTVHDEYLRQMGPLRDVTMIVLNQIDRLTPPEVARCHDDLVRLVEADGLPGVPIVATSTLTGEGVGELRSLLEKTVGAGITATARIEAELESIAVGLRPLVDVELDAGRGGSDRDGVPAAAADRLADALATAAGVEAIVDRAVDDYAARSRIPVRKRREREADVPPADAAAVRLAVRRFSASVGEMLPPPWPEAVWDAARVGVEELPEALAGALTVARSRRSRSWVWRVARVLFWAGVAAAVAGLAWVVSDRDPGSRVSLPALPKVDVPVLGGVWVPWFAIAGGTVLALVVLTVGRSLATAHRRREHSAVRARLRGTATALANEVVAAVRPVLHDYAEARAGFLDAQDRDDHEVRGAKRR